MASSGPAGGKYRIICRRLIVRPAGCIRLQSRHKTCKNHAHKTHTIQHNDLFVYFFLFRRICTRPTPLLIGQSATHLRWPMPSNQTTYRPSQRTRETQANPNAARKKHHRLKKN
ncbi:unnamed protein product [Ectocarpus sp. 13 AM-2016]